MRPIRALPIAVILIAALTACLPEEEKGGMHTSPNGVEFAFLPMADAGVVSISVAWPQPWAAQSGRNLAVPHVAPDVMVSGGAQGYAPGALLESFADLGAEAALYTQFDTLRGEVIMPPESMDEVLEAANAVLTAPSFDAGWLGRIADDMLAAQRESNALADSLGFYALRLGMMGDTPYTENLSLMDTDAIAAITPADLAQWHRETLVLAGIRVAVAGPIDAAAAGAAVDRLLAGLPAGEDVENFGPTFADAAPKTVLLHVPDAGKTTLVLAAALPPSGTDADAADLLGALALGGDEQSLLFSAVRTELRASYSMSASLDAFARKARILVMLGEVDSAALPAARDAAIAAYTTLQTTALDVDAVARWRDIIRDGLTESLATDAPAMSNGMIEALLDQIDPMTVQRLPAMFDAASPDAILARYSADYPPPNDLWVLAISPDATALPGACVITAPREVLACP
jgi:zinc protease